MAGGTNGECQWRALLGIGKKLKEKGGSHWRRRWSEWRQNLRVGVCGHWLNCPAAPATGTPSGVEILPRLANRWARNWFKPSRVGNVPMGRTINSDSTQ
jgi:hypothetical protein